MRQRWRRSPTLRIVAFALAWRLFTAAVAFLANILFPMAQRHFSTGLRDPLFWETFARYDAGWYFGIARYGYEFVEGGRSNLAFMPVYPVLMRYVALAMGGGSDKVYLAGILISWVSYVAAMVVLYRLARLAVPRVTAERAVVLASVFPFAFFYGVVYAEALYLLLALTAFYGFATGRWWMGGLAGALVTATRVNGILILPALALLVWSRASRDRATLVKAGVALALVPLGLALYSLYVWSLSGSFLEWMYAIKRWNYHPGGAPWDSLVTVVTALVTRPYDYLTRDPMGPFDTLNGSQALIFALAIPFVWRRLGAAYGVFMLANLWLPLSSGSLEGLGRYCAVLFPFFIWLAGTRSRTVRRWVLVSFAALYMLCLALFTNVYAIL
jgi:hypothetical protein